MAFESLTEKLQNVFKNLRSKGRLTEADVKTALKEVKMALLEADVSFKVVKQFIKSVQEQAVGQDVMNGLNPGQMVIKIVNDELVKLMGSETTEIALRPASEVTIIMMAGLQGAGKTTTTAKIAGKLKAKGRKPLLAACDVYRPAAIKQLQVNGEKQGVEVFAMTGQDAVNVSEMFNNKVGIDGVVLTKLDGDTRGGAALSIRAVSGKPILYVGMGEKLSDLEQFYPDRMASRILGMGDVMSLIEKAQANIDEEKAKAMEQKMKKAQFDFNDYLDSMEQMRNMGGISSILNMLPGVGAKMKGQDLESMVDEKDMARKEAIVLSMTPKERETPDLINPSRKQRIAKGAGVDIAEVNRFIKQFEQSRKMMKQMTGMVGKGGKRGGFKLPF